MASGLALPFIRREQPLWRAGLSERRIARAGLRSSPNKHSEFYQIIRGS
ncbi:hypothetical protein EDF80_106445 [Pseudomonas brenneri]|nr:hypothetical protein EDF80_106445 [Pseudomonas brenneri]SED26909.1 hypothetical protein SAMN04490200_0899 [Pseudomonas proteolytica]